MIKGTRAEWGTCSRTVSLGRDIWGLSYWNNTIAVGSGNRDIIILDAITGSQMAALPGHTNEVNCVIFSSDGKSLVSGSDDKTVKLWDVQTGGVTKTFYGHTKRVWSVSTSADYIRIASGSEDRSIHFWNVQRGECLYTIQQEETVDHIIFSPIDPCYFISASGGKIWQWDINGHQIPPTYNGTHIAFSPDHAQFALCNGKVITVQNSDSRAVIAEFHVTNDDAKCCCFSPDGRLVAAAVGRIAYVWNITSPDPHLIDTFVGHTGKIKSLVFSSPSSLISASNDASIKFWQVGVQSAGPVTADLGFALLTPSSIQSVSLQTRAGIAISSDAEGVVKIWDISTGLCKASFQTPATRIWKDAQLIDGKIIIIWLQDNKIHIWDTNKSELLQAIDEPPFKIKGLRISGDRSKIFCLAEKSIHAWSISTGEPLGEVKLELEQSLYLDPLHMDGSKIWIRLKDLSTQGWDFSTSGSPSVPLSIGSTGRPPLDFIGSASWQTDHPSWIKDTATGKEVFQLSGRYAEPNGVQWDGRYLVAGYKSGEVLIVDFHHV